MKKYLGWTALCVTLLCLITAIGIGCSTSAGYKSLPGGSGPQWESLGNSQSQAQAPGSFQARGAGPGSPALAALDIPGGREELWIIQKSPAPAAPSDDVPGTGALVAKLPDSQSLVPVPLKHTDVKASILAYVATTRVRQEFHNPFDTKIEAVYVFPLPHNAAINEFVMTVGPRKIRGIIREREEAQRIYNDAKSQGYVASLLTQERPNVFTQSVANIEPGKQIDVEITYYHALEYQDGGYQYVFPMVVGPRFNPPNTHDGIAAVPAGTTGNSGQKTQVQYLKPDQRSGADIALSVEIAPGLPWQSITSINHDITIAEGFDRPTSYRAHQLHLVSVDHPGPTGPATIALSPTDSIPNKDFVLRYTVAGQQPSGSVIAQRTEKGGYFTLVLFPPSDAVTLARRPVEMVFTLDTSGSMSGRPIEQSKAAMRYALNHMNPADTFQIIRFGDTAEKFVDRPVPATPENLRSGLRYIDQTGGSGGTMMAQGIRASLDFPHDPQHTRYVAFLTDGFIGNETECIQLVNKLVGPARIFSFGVGSSPNRYLMDALARSGRGCAAYLSLNDNADEVMAAFFDRASRPAMTDVAIDFGGLDVSAVYPAQIPDLLPGRPVILTGRFNPNANPNAPASTVVRVTGRVGPEVRTLQIPVRFDQTTTSGALASLWARSRITALLDTALAEGTDPMPQVKALALEYGLMSPFTAFVAVDAAQKTAGSFGATVGVPVPVPDGVKYETTVNERPASVPPAPER